VPALADNDAVPVSGMPPAKPRTLRGRLYSNAVWTVGGRAVSMGSAFAANVVLARELPLAAFSAYTVAVGVVGLLAMPAAFGSPRIILRLIREGVATHRPSLAIDSLRECMRLVSISSTVLALLFIAGTHFLDDQDRWRAIRDYSLLVAAWFSLSAISVTLAHALQGFDDFRASAMVGAKSGGILANVCFFAASAAAGYYDRLDLRFALAAQALLQLISVAYAWYALRTAVRRRVPKINAIGRGDAPLVAVTGRWFLHECWPILIIQLTSLGIAQIDVLLVSWLTDDRQIANYGAVAKICELLATGQVLAVGVAAPFISELYATQQLEKLEQLLRGVASLVAIPIIIIGAVLLAVPAMALTFIYGPDFVDGAPALQVGVIGCAIAGLTGVNSLVMIMAGRQRQLLTVSAIASVFYILTSPVMIIHWGITGAAAATTIIFGGYNVVVTVMVKSQMGIWTTASFKPNYYTTAYQRLFRR
jgi:O-antigen/teichoic acid export membrane protein